MRLPQRALAALAAVLMAVLVGGLAGLAVLLTAPTASAAMPDGCGDLDLADHEAVFESGAAVDQVFVGRVDNVIPAVLPGGGSADTSRHRVFLQVVLAGDLATGRYVEVVFTPTDTVEDRKLRVGERYLFFADGSRRDLRADGCAGWAPATGLDAAELDEVRKDLAEPPASVEEPGAALGDPPADADATPDLGRLLAPGGALSLVGVLGLVLLNRLGRQRG